MSEKYTIVQHEKRLFWLQNCPVLLQSYALTKNNADNSIFLQCKFENIADKSIKAMYIAVKCSDIAHKEISKVDNFSYLDIAVQPYSLFGDKTPVSLPDNTTRNVRIIPLKVIFSDDTTWENTSERAYELAEYEQQPISALGELADQYKRDLHNICADSDKHNYLPTKVNGFTICGCGQVVKSNVLNCPACGVTIENLFALNNSDVLQEHLAQYQVTQEQAQKNQKAKKRKFLRGITAVGIAVVLAVSIPLGYSAIKKNAFMKAHDTAQAYSDRFAASSQFAAWIEDDGTVQFVEPSNDIQLDKDIWHNMQKLYTAYGGFLCGIRADSSSLSINFDSMETDISPIYTESTSNVIQEIDLERRGRLQLLKNGTVHASKKIDTSNCKNIVEIIAFGQDAFPYAAALSFNGTVTLIGVPSDSELDTAAWKNIIQMSASRNNIYGLQKDGTVVATGDNYYGQCDVENWTDIVAIKAQGDSIYGIKKDGTIVGAGEISQYCSYDLNEVKLW